PGDRYASAAALAEELRCYLEWENGPAPRAPKGLDWVNGPVPHAPKKLSRRRWVFGPLAGAAMLAGVLLLWWRPSCLGPLGSIVPEPLSGYADLEIQRPGEPRTRRLNDDRALPLKAGDGVAVEVELNRSAYLYVLWINTAGEVAPVYPWRPGHWEDRPDAEVPVRRLRRPEERYYPMKKGVPGMETLVVFARETPLPRE